MALRIPLPPTFWIYLAILLSAGLTEQLSWEIFENCANTIPSVDNNILVFGSTKTEHDAALKVLSALATHQLCINPAEPFWRPGGHIFRVPPEQTWHPPQPGQDSTIQRGSVPNECQISAAIFGRRQLSGKFRATFG